MRKNQHNVPAGDKWGIKGDGNSRLTSTFDRQSDAIVQLVNFQKSAFRAIIHGRNGQIQRQ